MREGEEEAVEVGEHAVYDREGERMEGYTEVYEGRRLKV